MMINRILKVTIGITVTSVLSITIVIAKNIEVRNGFLVSRSQASFIVPRSIDEMISSSDLIVIGRPLESFNETTPDIDRLGSGDIAGAYSPTMFQVNRVIKGNVEGDKITINQDFAIVRDTPSSQPYVLAAEDYQPLIKGKKYLLFLERGMRTTKYYISGVYFGKVNIDRLDTSEDQIQSPLFQRIRASVIQKFQQVADQTP